VVVRIVSIYNTEDTEAWYGLGEQRERQFIKEVAPLLGLKAEINPAKACDKTAPDLLVNGKIAELKTEETPFFTARQKYGIDPQYAVSFNLGDYLSYKDKYPTMNVYFWVNWKRLEWQHPQSHLIFQVQPMFGVYRANVAAIAKQIEAGTQRLHAYKRRIADLRNERHSYGLDVRHFERLCEFNPQKTTLQAQVYPTL
jgi:hypothetical protein